MSDRPSSARYGARSAASRKRKPLCSCSLYVASGCGTAASSAATSSSRRRALSSAVAGPSSRSWRTGASPGVRRDLAHSPVPLGKMRQQARRGYRLRGGIHLAQAPGEPPRPVVPADRARRVEAITPAERVRDRREDGVGSGGVEQLEQGVPGGFGVVAWIAAQVAQERLLELLPALVLGQALPPGVQRFRVVRADLREGLAHEIRDGAEVLGDDLRLLAQEVQDPLTLLLLLRVFGRDEEGR